jgi:hypothetical protein
LEKDELYEDGWWKVYFILIQGQNVKGNIGIFPSIFVTMNTMETMKHLIKAKLLLILVQKSFTRKAVK